MEWIEIPLLMLEVPGSNPGHSISKIPLLYSEALEAPRGAGRTPQVSGLRERDKVKPKKMRFKSATS